MLTADGPIYLIQQLIHRSRNLAFFKSPEGRMACCSTRLLALAGYKNPKDIIGRTDFDCSWAAFALRYRADDAKVCETGTTLEVFEPFSIDQKMYLLHTTKQPIYGEDRALLGMFGDAKIIEAGGKEANDILFDQWQHESGLSVTGETVKQLSGELTIRQSEVLYFLLRGFTAKEIAQRLTLSFRTVQSHIELLKTKFVCQNSRELIHEAVKRGYIYLIPETLV